MVLHLHRIPRHACVSIVRAACGSIQWLLRVVATPTIRTCLLKYRTCLHYDFGCAYLSIHDRLFKSRSCHRRSPWILTPRPNGSSVWCLHHAFGLSILSQFLQSFVLVWALNCHFVRLRNIGYLLWLIWVVDLLLAVRGEGIGALRTYLSAL